MGKNIDYRIRTSKYIERRMFLDILRKLKTFGNVEEYRYIGFGSIYFTDFILFHKYLNITDMISIEKKSTQQERYFFNKPYRFIQMKFGECENIIADTLQTHKNKIIWLDYDSFFKASTVLNSINEIISNINSGSILFLSFNIDRKMDEKEREELKDELSNYLGLELMAADFEKNSLPRTFKKIIDNYIQKQLRDENIGREELDKIEYKQLVFTKYKDSIDMLSIGGIFVSKKDMRKYEEANFTEFEFVTTNDELYIIDVPILTSKEIQLIDNDIVNFGDKLHGIIENEINKYKKLYRYYPHYVDSDIL